MSRYATRQEYGGRRATVGAIVLLAAQKHDGAPGACLRAGVVVAISSSGDRPYIQDLKTGEADWGAPVWKFVDLSEATVPRVYEACLEELEVGSWTWPAPSWPPR